MYKRITQLLLVLSIFAMSLAACNGGEENLQTTQPIEPTATDALVVEEIPTTSPILSVTTPETTESAASDTGDGPDLAIAAETLGITEQELMDALGPPPPDFAAAAQTLGISEDVLKNALDAAGGGTSQEEPLDAIRIDNYVRLVRDADDSNPTAVSFPIVDTGQTKVYNNSEEISFPQKGEAFYGQDAQHDGNQMSYTISADGLTVYDNVTGLTWTKSPDLNRDGTIDKNDKLTFEDAQAYPDTLNGENYGGYDDWRVPTMKQLYSLMNFNGQDPSNPEDFLERPFIDTDYFDFAYGNEDDGERIIDSQYWSSNAYSGIVFCQLNSAFGLNLADGRIKSYPTNAPDRAHTNFVLFVRGNTEYGVNDFKDNNDGTITDGATGLMWPKDDSGSPMNWQESLAWVQTQNANNYLGYSDWRLPNAKEMHSILDYSRSPDATNSAAIDLVFNSTKITNEEKEDDYPYYYTGTTHVGSDNNGEKAVYISFGRAMGWMDEQWCDLHGAGAQRSDPKGGELSDVADYDDFGWHVSPGR